MSYGLRRAVDPFHEDPLPRAFYHPSRQKNVNGKHQKNYLSPERLKCPSEQSNTQEEEPFLHGSHQYKKTSGNFHQDDDKSSYFDESWPASERPSTPSNLETDSDCLNSPYLEEISKSHKSLGSVSYRFLSHEDSSSPANPQDKVKSKLDFEDFLEPEKDLKGEPDPNDKATEHTSILSKYIERFRKGSPKSREERQQDQAASRKDFWWLNHSSSPATPPTSSTPKQDEKRKNEIKTQTRIADITNQEHNCMKKASTLTVKNLESSGLGNGFLNPWDENDQINILQEKANQILEKTESSLHSTEPAVSTDGLGQTSDTTSFVSEVAYMPSFLQRKTTNIYSAPLRPTRKEDDILYQWRLKRRMELAKEKVIRQHVLGEPSVQSMFDNVRSASTSMNLENDHVYAAGMNSKLTEFQQKVAGVSRGHASSNFTPTPVKNTEDLSSALPQRHIPIASPHVPGYFHAGATSHEEPYVPVHLHLACDILPHPQPRSETHKDGTVEICSQCHSEKPNNMHSAKDTQTDVQNKIGQHPTDNIQTSNQPRLKDADQSSKKSKVNKQSGMDLSQRNSLAPGDSVKKKQDICPAETTNDTVYSCHESEHDQPVARLKPGKKTIRGPMDGHKHSELKYADEMIPEKDPGGSVVNSVESIALSTEGNHEPFEVACDMGSQQSLTDVSELDEDHTKQNFVKSHKHSDQSKKNKLKYSAKSPCASSKSQRRRHLEQSKPGISHENMKTSSQISDKQNSKPDAEQRQRKGHTKDMNQQIPDPQDTSSPQHPLSSTIGQIVREHFVSSFSADSDKSLRSSANTLPPTTSAPLTDNSPVMCIPKVTVHRSTKDDSISFITIGDEIIELSDGEDFADDELLQTLRERRQFFLQKLVEIDSPVKEHQ